VSRVLAAQIHPTFERAPIIAKVGTATRAAALLGEERFERCHRVDLAAAGPAGEFWHPGAARSDLRQGCQRRLDPLDRVFVVLKVPSEITLVRRQVEMAVAAQVEQDDLGLTGIPRDECLVDRDA
jgi:uncharacterized protein (DUF58 family)